MANASSSSSKPSALPLPLLAHEMPLHAEDSITLKRPRTLVLCFDGTSNQFDGTNTNVVKFYALLKKDAFEQQLCYYQPGIGTYFNPGVISPIFQWGAKIMDEAVAWYLDAHVQGGYQFLMQNWRPGDKICIFGFSRGAYTARALAGMLHKIGLLPQDNPEQVPFAYKLFQKTDDASVKIAAGFKRTFCRSVTIEFVGVWDTVASVGVIMGKNLPFTTSNKTIKTFRHALSLDERRVKFRPNLYHRPAPDSDNARMDPNHSSPVLAKAPKGPIAKVEKKLKKLTGLKIFGTKWPKSSRQKTADKLTAKGDRATGPVVRGSEDTTTTTESPVKLKIDDESPISEEGDSIPPVETDNDDDDSIPGGTDVLEVWFAGCHGDVGGGSVSNNTPHCLADISLRWMVRQVVLSQCGILFDQDALRRANIPNSVFTGIGFPVTPPSRSSKLPEIPLLASPFSSPRSKKVELSADDAGTRSRSASPAPPPAPAPVPSPPPPPTLDDLDAVQPYYDQLKADWLWWILEILPLTYTYQDGKGKWHRRIGFHMGRGRHIPNTKPNFHQTVKTRIEDTALKYKPAAKWYEGTQNYVE